MRGIGFYATRLFAASLALAVPLAANSQEYSASGLVDLGVVVPSHPKTWIKGGFGKLDNGGGGLRDRPSSARRSPI